MAYKGWHITWVEQYSQFSKNHNWYTFNLFMLELEDDRIMGGLEASVIIMGLGLRIRYNYTITEEVSDIINQVETIKKDIKIGKIPINDADKSH